MWDGKDPARLQQVLNAGEGTVRIPAGTFVLPKTLEIPANVQVNGAGGARRF